MKKIISMMMIGVMAFGLMACSGVKPETEKGAVAPTSGIVENKDEKQGENFMVLQVVDYNKEKDTLSASELNNKGVVDYIVWLDENVEGSIADFKTGDFIKVYADTIMESYPAQVVASKVVMATDDEVAAKNDRLVCTLPEVIDFETVVDLPKDLADKIDQGRVEEGYELVTTDEGTYVVVYLGERNSGGYGVEVSAVYIVNDEMLVDAQEIAPGKDAMVTMAITYPYTVVKVTDEKVSDVKKVTLNILNGDLGNDSGEEETDYYVSPIDSYKDGETVNVGEIVMIDGKYIHLMSGDLIQVYAVDPSVFVNHYIGEVVSLIKKDNALTMQAFITEDFSINHTNMGHFITTVTGEVTALDEQVFTIKQNDGTFMTMTNNPEWSIVVGDTVEVDYIQFEEGGENIAIDLVKPADMMTYTVTAISRSDEGMMIIEGTNKNKADEKAVIQIASSTVIRLNLSEVSVGDDIKLFANDVMESFPLQIVPTRIFK